MKADILVELCCKGDEKAWQEFQEKYGKIIYWYPVHKWRKHWHDFNEDFLREYSNQSNVVQTGEFYDEAIRRLKDKICKFDLFHKSSASFETWLFVVLNNLWCDLQRGKSSKAEVISGDDTIRTDRDGKQIARFDIIKFPSILIEDQVEKEEMINRINTLIPQFSIRRRLILKLWLINYFEILPEDIREIAEENKEQISTIFNRYQEILKSLKSKGSKKTTLSAREIGYILSCSDNTVGVDIMRIRKYFEEKFNK